MCSDLLPADPRGGTEAGTWHVCLTGSGVRGVPAVSFIVGLAF